MVNDHDGAVEQARAMKGQAGPHELAVPMDADLAARLAAFQRQNPDFMTIEDAARHIMRLWLTENGYDGLAHADAGRRPDALNASNDD